MIALVDLETPPIPSSYCVSDHSFGVELNVQLLNSRLVARAGRIFGTGSGNLRLWRVNESETEDIASGDYFDEARRRLSEAASLKQGWDTYDADPPNLTARQIATKVLRLLERGYLCPARLLPSSEGGIAISFVRNARRAEIEGYNSGEIAAVIYGSDKESVAWDLSAIEEEITEAIETIRVHLAQ